MAVSQILTLIETEVLASSNESKVKIIWRSTQTGESWNGYTRTAKYYLSINGGAETEYSVSYTLPKNTTNNIVNTVVVIPHKANGEGTLKVRTWMDTGISAGVVEKTESITLTPIARATTLDSLTCSSFYVNGTVTANYTPQNPAFYNKCIVYVNVNNKLTEIRTENLPPNAPKPYTIKLTEKELSEYIYPNVTNSAIANIRVTFRTYSDGGYSTKVGNDQSREIALLLPEDIRPNATLKIIPAHSSQWLTDNEIYAAGLSGATVTVEADPGKGAAMSLTEVLYDSKSYGSITNTVTLDIPTFKQDGVIKFTGKATDSRGRTTTTVSQEINILPYSSPTVTVMTTERGKYSTVWEANATGPDVRVVFKTILALVDKGNVYSAKLELNGDTKTISGLTSGVSHEAYFTNVNGHTSHVLKLTATDSVGYAGVATIMVPTTYITIEYKASGKGIAFGKTSEEDAFECV